MAAHKETQKQQMFYPSHICQSWVYESDHSTLIEREHRDQQENPAKAVFYGSDFHGRVQREYSNI